MSSVSEVSDIFETVEIETLPDEENRNILGAEIILADGENIVSVDVTDETQICDNDFDTNQSNEDLSGNYILMLPVHEGIGGLRILQATQLIDDFPDEPSSIDVNVDEGTRLDDVVETFISCSYEGCDKKFLSASQLKVHMRKHNGYEGGHECDYCKKKFSTGYALKAHRRTHTGEKPYTCPEASCEKRFKTSGDLQKHIRTHTGERPFKCGVCLKAFTTSNIRKVHMRVHTGEKPYQCTHDGCERRFSSATNFRNHLRIHTGEKPYICAVQNCQKRFTEYSSLYKHCTVHSERKRYQCSLCNRQYRQLSTLNIHVSTVHKNEVNLYQRNEDSQSTEEISTTYLRSINAPVSGSKVVSQHLVLHPKNGVIPKVNFKETSFKEVSSVKETSAEKFSVELPLKLDNFPSTGKLKENETILMSLNDSDPLYSSVISPPGETPSSKGTKDSGVKYMKPSAAPSAANFEPLKAITCGSEAILVLSVPPNASSGQSFEVDVEHSLDIDEDEKEL